MLLSLRAAATVHILVFAAFANGCGGDDASAAATEVIPSVYVSGLRSSRGAEWFRSSPEDLTPAELELPCDGRLVVSLVFTDFTARAPGACGATQQCGHVKVTLVPDADTAVYAETLAVIGPVLLQLPDPRSFVGSATLTARLLLDDGTEYVTAAGTPVMTSLAAVFGLADTCAELAPQAP